VNVLVISGSRNPEGQTAQAATAFLEGVQEAGGTGEIVFLPVMELERCRQCEDNGWGICLSEGQCIIEDDFAALTDQIRAADLLVFATPVYYGDVSESLRGFLERLRRIRFHEAGRVGLQRKPAVGICVAGGRGGGSPSCAMFLEKMLLNCLFDVIDVILARKQNLPMKLETLKTTGRWFGADKGLV
jgi:multimeric flavodoxin WrbA